MGQISHTKPIMAKPTNRARVLVPRNNMTNIIMTRTTTKARTISACQPTMPEVITMLLTVEQKTLDMISILNTTNSSSTICTDNQPSDFMEIHRKDPRFSSNMKRLSIFNINRMNIISNMTNSTSPWAPH